VGRRSNEVSFLDSSAFPTDWTSDHDVVNITEVTLAKCEKRILQQRCFDRKPLGEGVCYSCGRLLWPKALYKHPPMRKCEAPAAAYLKAAPKCSLKFEKCGTSAKWMCCSHCQSKQMPTEMHVGDIKQHDLDLLKPVSKWDMSKPKSIANLRNQYETGMTSLCTVFSDTAKQAGRSEWKHIPGEVNAMTKLDRHYYGLFGFLACREAGILEISSKPDSALRIQKALKWYRKNNHLYKEFFATYETLLRFVKPKFINPQLLANQRLSLEDLLQDEAVAMAFPVDSKFFDQYPLIYDSDAVAALQHPQPEEDSCRSQLKEVIHTKYGEMFWIPRHSPTCTLGDTVVGITRVH
jgi:hypothetical protein